MQSGVGSARTTRIASPPQERTMTLAIPDESGAVVRQPNHRLRRARLRLLSPSGSGRPLSRQELAEAVNAEVHASTGRTVTLDGSYVGRLERSAHRWPGAIYRQAFRTVLGATSDAELGFFILRRPRNGDLPALPQALAQVPSAAVTHHDGEQNDGSAVRLLVTPGTTVVLVPAGCRLLVAMGDSTRLAGADGQPADGILTTEARREWLGQ